MYHVSEDKRAVKSAELIWEGMEKCLQEKPLGKIRVADINEKSYVSRATFYRLFDSIQDVLVYECDKIFSELSAQLGKGGFSSSGEFFLFFIQQWLKQKTLVKVLAENNLTNILYATHMKNKNLIRTIFIRDTAISDNDADFLISILTGFIPTVIQVWVEHGQIETAEELFCSVRKSAHIIDSVMNGE